MTNFPAGEDDDKFVALAASAPVPSQFLERVGKAQASAERRLGPEGHQHSSGRDDEDEDDAHVRRSARRIEKKRTDEQKEMEDLADALLMLGGIDSMDVE